MLVAKADTKWETYLSAVHHLDDEYANSTKMTNLDSSMFTLRGIQWLLVFLLLIRPLDLSEALM